MARPVAVSVGPLATADPDGAGTTQKAAAAQYLVINGALSDGTTANNVCLSQSPGAAGAMTLNGSLVVSGVAYLGSMQRIYFTCAGNESAKTVVITGTGVGPSGISYSVTETLTLANASLVASQKTYFSISSIVISAASAGAITVGRAGTATFDTPRRFTVTSGGNDTGITFTVAGTDAQGNKIGEVITGASGSAAQSALDYKTILSVLSSGAVATTVTFGTNGVASSQWVRFDDYASMATIAIQCTVSGTVNYTVQQTLDDPNWLYSGITAYGMTWVDHPSTSLAAATATAQGNYAYAPLFARVTLNSGTGSVVGTFNQSYTG